ncbi:hypothetical protein EG68_05542 [Paragonimus skrjabini miyazakii]|uniref:Mediator complex subunit Med12 domain-containing protein n=1 Tax=Paragonimus skrjabini miyazakii TaxID=59628 RepID=A0A8S9YQ35_9TREM|nr:hypothetical protein EG68_05542 [Paragonimus skrjabini miyazakii]
MSSFPNLEHRSLKKKSHCPPDVYNQREEQKEDLMSEDFVRDGYKYIKPVRDEYDSCRKESKFINIDSLWKFCRDVLTKKYQHTNAQDFKKKQPSLRDSVVPVIDINKSQVGDWFKELGGSTSLQSLGRRVPYSKDKEEILSELLSNRVPISRAVWLINTSVIHTTAHAETTKRKPRAPFDPTSDWTGTICRMLKRNMEHLCTEHWSSGMESEWDYLFTLLIALYDADMADHWEIMVWLAKRAEGLWKPVAMSQNSQNHTDEKSMDILPNSLNTLKFFLHYLVKFGSRFTESELIARRLLYWCCSVFSQVVFSESRLQTNKNRNELQLLIEEYSETCSCPLHRSVVMLLSSLITCLTLNIPSSAVWNYIPFETEHAYLKNSPLDLIPYSLSILPMPPGPETALIRSCLFELEELIITRSKVAESGWNSQATMGVDGDEMNRLVNLLDILDRQDFHVVKEHNPMEALFNRIFHDDSINADTEVLITTLCEWAVSVHRVGIYRSIIIACLLEQLHNSLLSDPGSLRMLQETLVNFLDAFATELAPFTSDQAPVDNESMRNLVCLFSELIDREVFDHDSYVRRMIARGVFSANFHPISTEINASASHAGFPSSSAGLNTPGSHGRAQTALNICLITNLPNTATAQCSVASELSEDNDRCSMDNPDSVRSELGFSLNAPVQNSQIPPATFSCLTAECSTSNASRSPHFHYLAQFPLPQEESYTHEENQRYQLLCGSLRDRDRARYRIRQLVRDIGKMFTRKVYLIDVVHGEMCRRKKTKERDREKDAPNATNLSSTSGHRSNDDTHSLEKLHEDIMTRFVSLSYHDMECVISQCTPTFLKMLSGNNDSGNSASASDEHAHSGTNLGVSNPPSPTNTTTGVLQPSPHVPSGHLSHIYMPVPSSIFLFFELIEISLNITCLISTIVDTLERLQVLFEARTHFMTLYMSFLCLRSVGMLQRYQPVLFTMGDLSVRLFPTLITQVRQVKEPTQCGPFERCVLAYLNDLFVSSFVIKTRFTPIYGKAHLKVSALFRSVEPCEGVGEFNPEYATDLLKATASDNFTLFRAYAEDLRNNANSRFSFVCRAIIFVCQANSNERLNYLCGLCAELTSQCGELTPEWLGSLLAVLAPRPYLHGYAPIVSIIEPNDVSIYDNLSSLIGTLLSRHCFTSWDFLHRVICPAMAQGLDQPVGPQVEPSIRLACHILHRLFTAESTVSSLQTTSNVLTPNHEISSTSWSVNPDSAVITPQFRISEPLLLTGALQKVTPELLVDVLKMLIILNDKASLEDQSQNSNATENANEELDSDGVPVDDEDGDDTHEDGTDVETEDDADPPDNLTELSRRKRSIHSHHSGSVTQKQKRRRTDGRRSGNPTRSLHFIVQRFIESGTLPTVSELRSLPLSGLIQLVLREICTVSWVRERFCRMPPERLIRKNVLIDNNFSENQARRLLHIIFHPFDITWTDTANLAKAMCQVLGNLDLWTLRSSQVKFQLLYAQIHFTQQSDILGYVGQAIVRGFQTQALNWLSASGCGLSADGSVGPIGGLSHFELNENDPIWLLPTLVAKLPKSVKAQIVKATSETLKGIKQFWKHKNDEEKESVLLNNSVILAHPAFFSLLQICLLEADPLDSLYEQIEYFVENARETEDRVPDNLRTRQVVQECLRLRLTLVGQRFRALQSDLETSARWALLLTQLISHGVTEPESNSSLFYMVYDMLQSLVHTLAAKSDLEGKHYQNFVKKVRRELAERPPSYGIEQIRPLLPPLRTAYTVIVTGQAAQRMGASSSSGNFLPGGVGAGVNKSGGTAKTSNSKGTGKAGGGHSSGGTGSHSNGPRGQGKKRGLTIISKERLAPWDTYDPSKQAMLLSMHGATHIEAIPSRIEEQANRLISHDHFILMRRSPDFYLSPVYADKEDTKSQSTLSCIRQPIRSTNVRMQKSDAVCSASTDSALLLSSSSPQAFLPTSVFSSVSLAVDTSRGFAAGPDGSSHHATNTFSDFKTRSSTVVDHPLICDELRRSITSTQSSECSNVYSVDTDPNRLTTYGARHPQSEYMHSLPPDHLSRTSESLSASATHRQLPNRQYAHSVLSAQQQQQQQADTLAVDSFSAHVPQKRRVGVNQERAFGDNLTTSATELSSHKSIRMSSKFVEEHMMSSTGISSVVGPGTLGSQAPTTKRKRGPGRRGSASAANDRGASNAQRSNILTNVVHNAPGNYRPTTSLESKFSGGQVLNYQVSMHSNPNAEHGHHNITVLNEQSEDSWIGKPDVCEKMGTDLQQSRTSAPMASFRGFIRNRAQQQQQQQLLHQQRNAATSSQQQGQQQMYSYANSSSTHQTVMRPIELHEPPIRTSSGYGSSASQQTDLSANLSYSSSVHNLNSFAANDVQSVASFSQSGSINPHTIEQASGRQQSGGPAMHRYLPQLSQSRSAVGMHSNIQIQQQQTVPNPPPYPLTQQTNSNPQTLSHQQQHTFPRNSEDNYTIMVDNSLEDPFNRVSGQPSSGVGLSHALHHHPSYQTMSHTSVHQSQQQLSGDTVSVQQLVHHQQHPGSFQRASQTAQIVRQHAINHPNPVTQNLASQAPQQYSRFTTY